jgi:hypothetical protein
MTLLRRAPREVYRLYGEEEFLACAGGGEERAAATAVVVARRLHRVAGATALLAATGAVGGLLAIAGPSLVVGDRRRVGAGLLVATRSLASPRAARAHVWREPPGSYGSRQLSVRDRPADRAHVARRAGASRVGASRAGAQRPLLDVASDRQGAPAEVAAPASVVRLTASAASQPRQPGQSEFGFER